MTFFDRLRHPLSIVGAVLATAGGVGALTLGIAALIGEFNNPYFGLVVFVALPAVFVFGLLLIPIGAWRLRKKGEAANRWPLIDFGKPHVRQMTFAITALTVVNVIIVDFRGFDTLGEISVLGVVGIIVYAVLRRFRPASESVEGWRPPSQSHDEDLRVPGVLMRLMFFAAAVFAAHLLLRGHNLPGGGFVAGLALSIGVIVLYMAGGTQWAEDRLGIRPLRWIAVGLLVAAATGSGSWLFAHAFLTSHTASLRVPLLGETHLPSAFFFDFGVFALVVGATGLILLALAHQSTRATQSGV